MCSFSSICSPLWYSTHLLFPFFRIFLILLANTVLIGKDEECLNFWGLTKWFLKSLKCLVSLVRKPSPDFSHTSSHDPVMEADYVRLKEMIPELTHSFFILEMSPWWSQNKETTEQAIEHCLKKTKKRKQAAWLPNIIQTPHSFLSLLVLSVNRQNRPGKQSHQTVRAEALAIPIPQQLSLCSFSNNGETLV